MPSNNNETQKTDDNDTQNQAHWAYAASCPAGEGKR